jgi:hypothetical protein
VKRPVSFIIASLAMSLLVLGVVGSCKQGEGERCQVQDDCEEGLQCNVGEGVCRAMSSGDIDAELPPDILLDDASDASDASDAM